MYHALDIGISCADFWEMSARAIINLQREMIRCNEKAMAKESAGHAAKSHVRKLASLPRP